MSQHNWTEGLLMNYAEIGFLMHFHILIKLCRPQCPFKLTYSPHYFFRHFERALEQYWYRMQDVLIAHLVVLRFVSRDY